MLQKLKTFFLIVRSLKFAETQIIQIEFESSRANLENQSERVVVSFDQCERFPRTQNGNVNKHFSFEEKKLREDVKKLILDF